MEDYVKPFMEMRSSGASAIEPGWLTKYARQRTYSQALREQYGTVGIIFCKMSLRPVISFSVLKILPKFQGQILAAPDPLQVLSSASAAPH
jgi:hypothetical protein